MQRSRLLLGAVALAAGLSSRAVGAFPPYRTTDADTAKPWSIEARLGFVRAEREGSEIEVSSPLLRVNLGLPHRLELVTEAEYIPKQQRLGDAAAGGKWVILPGKLALGTEVLALLPISEQGGIGIEAQALATYRVAPFRLHLNAGGFADDRTDPAETGWRASGLAELELGVARPGLELFTKQVRDEPVQALIGLGSIVALRVFDLRLAVHAGLTDASPDLVGSVWVSTELPLTHEKRPGDE